MDFKIDTWGLGAIALGLASLQIMLDKGQREDWFSSHLIVALAVIAVVSLAFVIFWSCAVKEPIIDIRLLGRKKLFLLERAYVHAGPGPLWEYRAFADPFADAHGVFRHDRRASCFRREGSSP